MMRATLVLSLCKLGLVTRTSRIRSQVDHAPLSVSLFRLPRMQDASGSQNPSLVRGFPQGQTGTTGPK
jgi:hypothetical protein